MYSVIVMKPASRKILLLATFSLILLGEAEASHKNAGATFSPNGFSISYERFVDDSSFMEVGLKAECLDLFFGQSDLPGISSSFTWNMIIAERMSPNGNPLRFFAGPGICLGWGHDYSRSQGLSLGLKGRVGVECDFDRNITVSVSLAPYIGVHLQFTDKYLDMRYSRAGVLSAALPEIGIKYRF